MKPADQIFSYPLSPQYPETVAYYSMEFAIDQALKTYCGGLGYLAGSFLRSAMQLGQPVVGIGILWKYGYYDEARDTEGFLKPVWTRKHYSFLEDTGVVVSVTIHGSPVRVKAFLLAPDTFGCAPVIFLSTDIPENDFLARTITERLYDPNESTRIAQSIVLGRAGAMVLEALQINPSVHHLNEGHALPLIFQLYSHFQNLPGLRDRVVFTTHTSESAGNEVHAFGLLNEMSFFDPLNEQEARSLLHMENDLSLNYTLAALRVAHQTNGVSAKHAAITRSMWSGSAGICGIIGITNAQNQTYWQDEGLGIALNEDNESAFTARKKAYKRELFKVVADQCGKLFDDNVLTIVWARRFSGYKRAGLLLQDMDTFRKLFGNLRRPLQFIWAGKPYPEDEEGIALFNQILLKTEEMAVCAVLFGYDLRLSALLKKGSDVWLNTPRIGHEASGTSGMTAAMNGSLNLSIPDGWVPEFAADGKNCFIIPPAPADLPESEADRQEGNALLALLGGRVPALYYDGYAQWFAMLRQAAHDVVPAFESGRMAHEYYNLLYRNNPAVELPSNSAKITSGQSE